MTTERDAPSLILRPLDPERDLDCLAQMWRESDDQWPGTVSDGVPIDAAWVRTWLQREKYREVAVWAAEDVIAGYCSLWDYHEEPGVVYIATLNVAPRFQNRGLGRRFLTYFVERAVELGAPRLDLHTWAGNLKAVPLYKKCGFFWEPGPSVHMVNLLPAILRMPAARSFFASHDWYASFQRELSQAEDDERWEGMQVFTYRFVAGDDSLTVWGHRQSRAVTAIETAELFAAAIVGDETPARGLKAPIRWKVVNKRAETVDVTLIATGTTDLQLDHRASLRLDPGATVEVLGKVAIAPDMEDIRPGRVAPSVRSILMIGGTTIELNTGLRPHAPVEVATFPEHITLAPGVARVTALQLRSRLDQDVTATIVVSAAPGLETDWLTRTVPLPANGFAGIPLSICAARAGVYEFPVMVRFDHEGNVIDMPVTMLAAFVLPAGGVLGARIGDRLRVENEFLRLIVEPRGARTGLYDPASNERLGGFSGYAVPPVAPSEYWDAIFDLSVERCDGQVIATASTASWEHPGFVLRRRIAIGASPVLTMTHEFDNRGAVALHLKLRQQLEINNWCAERVLPLDSGMARDLAERFPGVLTEDLKRPARYAEGWAAVEGPLGTIGMLFPDDLERIDWSWDGLVSRFYDCPPGVCVTPAPLVVYVGPGGWQAVRRLWQRRTGRDVERGYQMPQPADAIAVRTGQPVTMALAGEELEIELLVEHARARPLTAAWRLLLPAGWRAAASEGSCSEVSRDTPYRQAIRLTAPDAPGAAQATIALRSPDLDEDFGVSLICPGRHGPVYVREMREHDRRLLAIDNGRLNITIAPDFAASVCSLRAGGVEWLRSAFPAAGTFGWMSPWFGGFTPILHIEGATRFPGVLWQESFEATETEDAWHGLRWRGVRQRATAHHHDLHGLEIELDTLTLHAGPLVRLVMRIINQTPVWRSIDQLGWLGFVQPGGDSAPATLWGEGVQVKHSDRIEWHGAGRWVAAESVATGATLLACSPLHAAMAIGWGVEGGHIGLLRDATVPPGGVTELPAFLVVTSSIAEARRWATLVQA